MNDEDDGGDRRHDSGKGSRVPAAAAAREARIFPVKSGISISFGLGQDARLFCVLVLILRDM